MTQDGQAPDEPQSEGERGSTTDYASALFRELTAPGRARDARWARLQQLVADGEAESLHLDFKSVGCRSHFALQLRTIA